MKSTDSCDRNAHDDGKKLLMFDSYCIILYADIIKGVMWHYAYTDIHDIKHHVDFFLKRDGKATGIPCGMQMFWVDAVTFFS